MTITAPHARSASAGAPGAAPAAPPAAAGHGPGPAARCSRRRRPAHAQAPSRGTHVAGARSPAGPPPSAAAPSACAVTAAAALACSVPPATPGAARLTSTAGAAPAPPAHSTGSASVARGAATRSAAGSGLGSGRLPGGGVLMACRRSGQGDRLETCSAGAAVRMTELCCGAPVAPPLEARSTRSEMYATTPRTPAAGGTDPALHALIPKQV